VDDGAGTVSLNGVGAFMGLAKVFNGGELTNPADAPESITYDVTMSDEGETMTLLINIGSGYWTFKLVMIDPVSVDADVLPDNFALLQNYPNPFNPTTTIKYGLSDASSVSLTIYDIRGNVIRTMQSGTQPAGWYQLTWNGLDDAGRSVSTGVYLTRLQAGSTTQTIKMLYLK
jgi:hypothetical protein